MNIELRNQVQKITICINDMAVENPTASECGRFSVSPKNYGFSVWNTGGNCTAWGRKVDSVRVYYIDGTEQEFAADHVLVTDDGCSHEFEDGDQIMFGAYDVDGNELAVADIVAGAF